MRHTTCLMLILAGCNPVYDAHRPIVLDDRPIAGSKVRSWVYNHDPCPPDLDRYDPGSYYVHPRCYMFEAARVWRSVGVEIYVRGEVGVDTDVPGMQTIEVRPLKDLPSFSCDRHGLLGCYAHADGNIYMYTTDSGGWPFDRGEWSVLLAHEIGHAIGLEHLPDCKGVMSPTCFGFAWEPHLMQPDIDLYEARWGNR